MPIQPRYDLATIRYATDAATFEKAVGLYEDGHVTQFMEELGAYSAIVLGTKPYRVVVAARRHDEGHCECYLGERGTLCKHMVAVAIYATVRGRPLTEDDKRHVTHPVCSGRLGTLADNDLAAVKQAITAALRYIKPYRGPSRLWHSYQHSLSEGCARLAKILSDLPVGTQTAELIVAVLLRLDKRLSGGTDDSDGTVGGFMEEAVRVLEAYAALDPDCRKAFRKLKNRDTCFGWEEPLTRLVGKQ